MDPGNSSHYLSLEKNISIVFNNRRADTFCKNSDRQTHKNGQEWSYTLQRQQSRNTKLMEKLW